MAVPDVRESVIELGSAAPWEPPPPTAEFRSRRWWRQIAVRHWVFVAALAVLVGAGVVRSAPVEPEMAEVFTASLGADGSFDVGDGSVYALRLDLNDAALSAYRLVDGTPQWTTPVLHARAAPDRYASVLYHDDVVLIISGGQQSVVSETTAYDSANGRLLWTRSGSPAYALRGPLVLHRPVVPDCPDPPCDRLDLGDAAPQVTEVVNSRTGAIVWSLEPRLPSSVAVWFDAGDTYRPAPSMLVMATGDVLEARDLASGRLVASRQVPGAEGATLVLDGGDLFVQQGDQAGTLVTSLDAMTMQPLWNTVIGREYHGMWPCGTLLCAGADGKVAVFDRATGVKRWELAGWGLNGELPGGLLVAYPASPTGEAAAAQERRIIDAQTGQTRFVFRGWDLDGRRTSRRNLLLVSYARFSGEVRLGQLDLDHFEIRYLGMVHGAVRGVRVLESAGRVYVYVHALGQQLRVLRLND